MKKLSETMVRKKLVSWLDGRSCPPCVLLDNHFYMAFACSECPYRHRNLQPDNIVGLLILRPSFHVHQLVARMFLAVRYLPVVAESRFSPQWSPCAVDLVSEPCASRPLLFQLSFPNQNNVPCIAALNGKDFQSFKLKERRQVSPDTKLYR